MATRIRWLLIPLVLAGVHAAHAEEPLPTEPEANRRAILTGRKVPPAREAPDLEGPADAGRPDWMNLIRIHKKAGLEMSRSFAVGEHEMSVGVKGPVMRRKRFGLTFELRF